MPISAATFTTPPTFASTPLTDSLMNNLIGNGSGSGGDLTYLNDFAQYMANNRPRAVNMGFTGGADYTITGTTFTAVDTTNLRLSILTKATSARVLLMASFLSVKATAGQGFFDWFVDGASTRVGGANGLITVAQFGTQVPVTMIASVSGLTADITHTFDVCFRSSDANTLTLYRNTFPVTLFGLEV